MSVHRDRHEDWSLFLAEPKARELLAGIYEEPELTVVVSEVLETITSHRESGHPLTLEAGLVRVADALDIEEGRSRIPFERGRVSIHSISSAAIGEVVEAGDVVIRTGCGAAGAIYPARGDEDCEVGDQAGKDLDTVRRIRDGLDERVRRLIDGLLAT